MRPKNLLMSLKLDKISKSNIVVSIIGPSNSGKSTLLNKVLGEKVSIVSRKVQTTRMGLRGILNNNETQIIFIDTPGLFEAKTIFEKAMVENAFANLNDADLIYFLIDGSRKLSNFDKKVLKYFKNFKKEAFLIINKIDLIEKKQLLEITNIINSYFPFKKLWNRNSAITRPKTLSPKNSSLSWFELDLFLKLEWVNASSNKSLLLKL